MSTPFPSLLDLDGKTRPRLRLFLDGEEYPLRAPEELSLRDAFRLGDAFARLPHKTGDRDRLAAVARGIVTIIAPDLPVRLSLTQALTLLAFYVQHLAAAFRRLTTPAGDPVPFSAPARASSRRRGSRRASAPDCGSSSPCR